MCRCSLFVWFLVCVCVCMCLGRVEFILFGIFWAFGMVFDFSLGRTLLIIITHCFKYFFCSIPFSYIVSLALCLTVLRYSVLQSFFFSLCYVFLEVSIDVFSSSEIFFLSYVQTTNNQSKAFLLRADFAKNTMFWCISKWSVFLFPLWEKPEGIFLWFLPWETGRTPRSKI